MRIIRAIILSVLSALSVTAQTNCVHRRVFDFWDSLRPLPVQISEVNGEYVTAVYKDDKFVKVFDFIIGEGAKLSKDFRHRYKGKKWLIFYSKCDQNSLDTIVWAEEMK